MNKIRRYETFVHNKLAAADKQKKGKLDSFSSESLFKLKMNLEKYYFNVLLKKKMEWNGGKKICKKRSPLFKYNIYFRKYSRDCVFFLLVIVKYYYHLRIIF